MTTIEYLRSPTKKIIVISDRLKCGACRPHLTHPLPLFIRRGRIEKSWIDATAALDLAQARVRL